MTGNDWVLTVLAIVALMFLVAAVRSRGRASAARPAETASLPGSVGVPGAASGSAVPEVPAGEPTVPDPPAAREVPAAETPAVADEPAPADEAPPLAVVPALASLDDGVSSGSAPGLGSGAAAAVSAAATTPGPYPGSVLPMTDGSAPSTDYPVKGNVQSHRYYTPDSPYFVRTRAEVWFASAADAEAAGLVPWNGRRVSG